MLMHSDCDPGTAQENWPAYLDKLSALGALRGGSAIGQGICMRRSGNVPDVSRHLNGYIKIEATDLSHAKELASGNPVFEAGGTVEIRELPITG